MLKNIIFDLGNVLVDFTPEKYLTKHFNDEQLVDRLLKIIFEAPEWKELDRGQLSNREMTARLCQKHPDLSREINFVGNNWQEMLDKKPGMIRIAEELKKKGYSLFILSNIHPEIYRALENNYDFFDLFNGQVISGKLGIIKPEKAIYRELITRYELQPQESIFIDDLEENINAAGELGFKTIHCTDTAVVIDRLADFTLLGQE